MEADLGYPGGKAKIIHKESDIIMAFAINKVSCGDVTERLLLSHCFTHSGSFYFILLLLLSVCRLTVMK